MAGEENAVPQGLKHSRYAESIPTSCCTAHTGGCGPCAMTLPLGPILVPVALAETQNTSSSAVPRARSQRAPLYLPQESGRMQYPGGAGLYFPFLPTSQCIPCSQLAPNTTKHTVTTNSQHLVLSKIQNGIAVSQLHY